LFGSALARAVCVTSFLAPIRQGKPSQVKQLMQRGSRVPAWLIARGVGDPARRRGQLDGRIRVGAGARRLARIVARLPVHLQQGLRLAVVRFQIGVRDRPAREVRRAQAQRRAAEEDRVAAHHLVREGLDVAAGAGLTHVHRRLALVAPVEQDGAAVPVGLVARRPAAALDQQHLETGARQRVGGRPPAEAGSDHEHVEDGPLQVDIR